MLTLKRVSTRRKSCPTVSTQTHAREVHLFGQCCTYGFLGYNILYVSRYQRLRNSVSVFQIQWMKTAGTSETPETTDQPNGRHILVFVSQKCLAPESTQRQIMDRSSDSTKHKEYTVNWSSGNFRTRPVFCHRRPCDEVTPPPPHTHTHTQVLRDGY